MYWVNTMVYTKTELYRTNTKSQGLVPAHFALIIIIVVHVVKHQSVLINTYMQKAGEHDNRVLVFQFLRKQKMPKMSLEVETFVCLFFSLVVYLHVWYKHSIVK